MGISLFFKAYTMSLTVSVFISKWANLTLKKHKLIYIGQNSTTKNSQKGDQLSHAMSDFCDSFNPQLQLPFPKRRCNMHGLFQTYLLKKSTSAIIWFKTQSIHFLYGYKDSGCLSVLVLVLQTSLHKQHVSKVYVNIAKNIRKVRFSCPCVHVKFEG